MDTIARLHTIAYELETDSLPSPTKMEFRGSSNDSVSEASTNQQELKVSYPFEPSLSKERCNLCRLHFSRETVTYKVPIHRIMELKKTWDEKSKKAEKYEGRRYNFPSYLYTTTSVCLFCSQFFSTMPEERQPVPPKADLSVLNKVEPGPKLEITTELQRTNIAERKKAYQSTEVDYKYAEHAVSPPYNDMTRTAREVDPWWEVDLGRKYSIESINFQILVGIRQTIDVYAFLLDKPIGFENPFLDKMLQQSYTRYRITFKGKDQPITKDVYWKLPTNTVTYAIRIQLKGIQTLSIQKFVALQGSELYLPTEEDLTIAQESYAALRPEVIEATLKEKHSLEMKALIESGEFAEMINNSEHSLSHNHSHDKIDAVGNLKNVIKDRYIMIAEWKEKVLAASSIFTPEEISSLYRVIFRYASDLNLHNKENNLTEHDLLTTGLTLFYPRCDLFELHSRIRSILYWIQTRSHLKTLGPLLNCNTLNTIANNSHEPLFRLMTIFKRIHYYWQKKEEKEKQHQLINEQSSAAYQNSPLLQSLLYLDMPSLSTLNPQGLIQPKVSEFQGCSWSQFLIIMNAFVTNQCDNIPYAAFNIDHPKPNAPIDDMGSQYTYRSGDGMSISSYSVSANGRHFSHHHHGKGRATSKQSSRLGSRSGPRITSPAFPHSSSIFSSSSINQLDQPSWGSSLFSPTQSMVMFQQSLTNNSSLTDESLFDVAKKHGKITHAFDSSFAEYRFSHFKRRQRLENIDFPKDLSLEFAKTLNPRRPMTSMHESKRGEENLGTDGEGTNTESDGEGLLTHPKSKEDGNTSLSKSLPILPSAKSSLSAAASLKKPSTAAAKGKPPAKPGLSRANTAALKDFMVTAGLDDDHSAHNGHTPVKRLASMNSIALQPLVANVQHLLSTSNTPTTNTPSLKRQATAAFKVGDHNTSMFSLKSSSSGLPAAARSSSTKKKPLVRSTSDSANHNNNARVAFKAFSSDDLDDDDFDDFDDDSEAKKGQGMNQIKNIDFFRICGLCELRLPRDAIEMKVFRKHIVKLRSTWDAKLVSKEVRSLDNTISMYNLVYVCYFCAQYFDPDFPDGIAYPTRIAQPKKKTIEQREKELEKDLLDLKSLLSADQSEPRPKTPQLPSTPGEEIRVNTPALNKLKLPDSLEIHALGKREETLTPFYDTRHLSNPATVGEVFSRPDTRESRKKAFRALEVVQFFEKRRQRLSSPPK